MLARFAGPAFIGIVIFLMAVIIALPIPFGNTLPGITVLIIALALAQRDDLALSADWFWPSSRCSSPSASSMVAGR